MALSRKNIVLIAVAAVCGFAAISVRNRLMQTPTPQAEAPQQQAARILVAKHDLIVGTFVQSMQDLDWAVQPKNMIVNNAPQTPQTPQAEVGLPSQDGGMPRQDMPISHDNYFFEGAVKITDFNGAVVRRSLHTGDPVPQFALMKAGEGGFMSAVLEPGKRAVSIAVNATSGAAGFVSPGDHVDLIVTQRAKTIAGGGMGTDEVVVSETFTHDVRVVAVDQLLDNPDNKAILAKTVTVEVTPRQAEQVAVASEMGKISLALRSLPGPNKVSEVKTPDVNAAAKPVDEHTKELKDLYGAEAQPEVGAPSNSRDLDPSQLSGHKSMLVPRVTIIRGDKSENIDFYQGR